MAGGLWSGLGKLLGAGTAYLQHVTAASQLLACRETDVAPHYTAYAQGLSEASFAGLKVTLAMLVGQEQDPSRKTALQRLLASADEARRGSLGTHPPPSPPAHTPTGHPTARIDSPSFDDDLATLGRWYDQLDGPGRQRALVEFVARLTPMGYRRFTEHVQRMIDNCAGRIQQHEQAESQSWGGSFEDRIAYGMARLQTGQRDPAWQRQMNQLQDVQAFFQAVLGATHELGPNASGRQPHPRGAWP